jgi:GH25 family lysozyme M1 (1,4-beta-N-acetylmuramidase)
MAVLRAAATVALVATLSVTGAGAASAKVVGPDVSSHNHDGRTLNWGAIRWVGGASFAFIKATEGGGYRNPSFSPDLAAARRHGLIRGAYHFARPSGRSNRDIVRSANAEAAHFRHAIGALNGPGNLAPVLDLEDAGALDQAQLSLWVHTWLKRVAKLTDRTPIIYTGVTFWKQSMGNSRAYAAYPLWVASYGIPRPAVVGGWKSYTFWQYTETGTMAGAGPSTDLSVFNGSFAQLKAMTLTRSSAKRVAAAAASARSAARVAAARQRVAAAQQRAAAQAKASADLITLSLTTRRDSRADGTTHGDDNSSRSSLRSWLGVYGMDGSGAMAGY